MGDPKDTGKAVKKAAKTAMKEAKARAKVEGQKKLLEQGTSSEAGDTPSIPQRHAGLTAQERAAAAAERSAAAAERQAHLQRYRVWYALLMVLIGLATLLATLRPWEYIRDSRPTPGAASTSEESGS